MFNLIVDGNNLLYRSFFVLIKQKESCSIEEYKNKVVNKFFSFLKNHINHFDINQIYICWDKKLNEDGVNPRKEILNQYKATRDNNHKEEIYDISNTIEIGLNKLGVINLHPYNLEADDIMYYLCKQKLKGQKNIILTSDYDLLQLVDKSTKVFLLSKRDLITHEDFKLKIGVDIKYFVLYKAMIGDSSDNIDGVPMIGEKRAKTLIKELKDKKYPKLSTDKMKIIKRNIQIIDLKKFWNDEETENIKQQLDKFNDLEFEIFPRKYFQEINTPTHLISEWNKIFDDLNGQFFFDKLFCE